MRSKTLLALMLAVILCTRNDAHAADLERGEALHAEHCQGCHDSSMYTRAERMVNDLEQLQERVRQCELGNNLLWFEEDVEDVSAYLNTDFYLFGIK